MAGRFDSFILTPASATAFPASGDGYRRIQDAAGVSFVAKHLLIRLSSPVTETVNAQVPVRFAFTRSTSHAFDAYRTAAPLGAGGQTQSPVLTENLRLIAGDTVSLDGVRIAEMSTFVASGTAQPAVYVSAWTDGGHG